MKACIITEGGKNMGLGHITRCTALYQAFKKEGIKPLFVVNGDKAIEGVLAGYDHVIFNWLRDKRKLFNITKDSVITVIDSYLAGADIYKEVADLTKAAVYLDDNMRINYPRGIVVNGAPAAKIFKYPKSRGVKYFLGGRYVILRKEFWRVPAKRIKADVESIMVTFGGVDGKKMTPKVLRFLNSQYPEALKNVIIGAGFKNSKEIKRFKDERVNLIYKPDAKKMCAVMLQSDIAISAGGQTLYELARVGVPTIAVCAADNQERNLQGWQRSGFIEYAGWYSDKKLFKNIQAAVLRLFGHKARFAKSKIGRRLVGGKGALLIAKYLADKRAK